MSKVCLLVLVVISSGFPSNGVNQVSRWPDTVKIGAILASNSSVGKVAKVAIEAAVKDVNCNPALLSGTNLSISMLDTKFSGGLQGIMEGTYLMLSKYVFSLAILRFFFQRNRGNSVRRKRNSIKLTYICIYKLQIQ